MTVLAGGPTLSSVTSPSPHDCWNSEVDVSDSDMVVRDFDSCSFFLLSLYPLAPALLLAVCGALTACGGVRCCGVASRVL